MSASAGPAGATTGQSLRSPAWMRQVPVHATPPVGGDLTEAELPGASNPSEPFAAASQAVRLFSVTGEPQPCCAPDPNGRMTVNPVTGDLSFSLDDLFVPERGVPLGLSLTYNSYFASTDARFGKGWSFNAGMSLTRAPDGSVTVSQENGSRVMFQNTSGHYTAAPRVVASLRSISRELVFTRGTLGAACPRYSRTCVKFYFSDPVWYKPGVRRLTKIATRDGALTLSYTRGGQLAAVKDPAGRALTFLYKKGKVTSTTLNANGGLQAHASYDATGNLTRFTNAGGGRYGFLYDAFHRPTGIVDPRGVETDVAYDSAGHVQSITGPGGETDFSRSPAQTSVSRLGSPSSTAHYAEREVTQIDQGDPAAPLATTLISYASTTLAPTAVTDPDGHTSHMAYDALGHLTSYTDPLGHTSVYHFGAATGIVDATDALGNVSRATTDSTGRVVTIAVDSSDAALTQTTTFHYDSAAHPGDVTSVTDAEGHVWHFTYDKFGNQTRVTDPLGHTTSASYDRMGRPAVNTLSNGNVAGANPDDFSTTYTYDPEGRMLSRTDPLGNTESFSYDRAGNVVATTSGGHQTSYGYDTAGRWTLVTRPSGSHSTLSYLSDGHVGEVCDDGGNCEEHTYDDLGRPATVTDALGNTSSFLYSPGGMLLSSTDANGVTTSYTHDADGRTTGVSYSDAATHPVTYDYDADGQLTGMTDGTGTSSFTYDSAGRRKHYEGLGMENDYAYDRLDHVTSMTLNSTPMASYTYDAAGRMASVRDRLGNTTTFSYDASSNLTQTLFPGGDVDRDGYDNAGRLVHFSLSDSTSDPASVDIAYTRNLLGQITQAAQTGTGQPSQTYDYDADGRLGKVNTSSLIWSPRSNLVQNAAGDTFTYDAANRLVSEDQKDVTPDVNWQFGYDDNGSRTSASTLDGTQSKSFSWDAAGNLTSFTDGSSSETNSYDGLGQQVSSTSGGVAHRFVWDSRSQVWNDRVWVTHAHGTGGGMIDALSRITKPGFDPLPRGIPRMAAPSGPLAVDGTVYLYGPEGLPVEQVDGSDNALFYHHDQLGSTRAVTDATGHTVEIVAYDAFGNAAYHSGSVTVPFGFGGAYTDPVSHLVLIGHDYYDPSTGQFLKLGTANGGVEHTGFGNARRGGIDDPGPNVGLSDIEIIFDKYEEQSSCRSTEVCGNGFMDYAAAAGGPRSRLMALEVYGYASCKSTEVCGNGIMDDASSAGDRTWSNKAARQIFLPEAWYLGLQPLGGGILLGTSPYALGGGDPINKVDPRCGCIHTPAVRSNISNN